MWVWVDRDASGEHHRGVTIRALSILFAMLLMPTLASAQGDMSRIRGGGGARVEPEPDPEPAIIEPWRGPSERGVQAFQTADFEAALEGFTRAYELGGPATLAYNMALSLDRLDRRADAVDAYRRYLTLVPEAANRTEVEARITVLEGGRARTDSPGLVMTLIEPPVEVGAPILYEASPGGDAPPLVSAPVSRPGPEWIVSWAFLGVTAASAAGAAIAGAVGQSQFDALSARCIEIMGCLERDIRDDPSHTSELAANALWVTTGILGGITIASFVIEGLVSANPPRRTYIDRGAGEGPTLLGLDVGPGSLRLRGSF